MALLLSVIMIFSTIIPAFAIEFADISDHWDVTTYSEWQTKALSADPTIPLQDSGFTSRMIRYPRWNPLSCFIPC